MATKKATVAEDTVQDTQVTEISVVAVSLKKKNVLTLRAAPVAEAPTVPTPAIGVPATQDVYAEILMQGCETPTYQMIAKAGIVVQAADLTSLPPSA